MPKGPKGQKRPADVISNAVHVMRMATGEITDAPAAGPKKNAAAVALGRLGGEAREKNLTKKQMSAIARKGGKARHLR